MSDFYVYVYLDPRKCGLFIYDDLSFPNEPFYIGKGKNDRIIEGLKTTRENRYKVSKISNIRKSNLEVIYYKLIDEKLAFASFSYQLCIMINLKPILKTHPTL